MKSILLALVSLLFLSCLSDGGDSKVVDYTVQNEKEIVDYIAKNNLNAQNSNSGLYYVINEAGTGVQPTAASNVTVRIKGLLLTEMFLIRVMHQVFDLRWK